MNEFFSVSINLLEKAASVIHETRKATGFAGLEKGKTK